MTQSNMKACDTSMLAPHHKRQEGLALLIAMTAIAILTVMLADIQENTSTGYAIAVDARDRLKAEYIALSAVNLTRMLIANEPQIRQVVAPLYQMAFTQAPPQIPVWNFANDVLKPFCDFEGSKAYSEDAGINLHTAKGLGQLGGHCEIKTMSESGKVNLNNPGLLDSDASRRALATQLYAMTGGLQNPSPYDTFFQESDSDGVMTSRMDLISSLIDWWDFDVQRTNYDPTTRMVNSAGSEDDTYKSLPDPYLQKNAPLDSVQELRLVRGFTDDFWATFMVPQNQAGGDENEVMTVYGSNALNPNEAQPEALLAKVCGFTPQSALCSNVMEQEKFTYLVRTARALLPIPWFRSGQDFVSFMEGKGNDKDLFSMLLSVFGQDKSRVFQPIVLTDQDRNQLVAQFMTTSDVFTVRATGTVGRSSVRLRAVVNFSPQWAPPPPNAGAMTGLGVIHYWRVE